MSAHTPGPWILKRWTAPDDYGWSIKIGDAPHRLDVSAWSESSEADARLIAAAPELLEALRPFANAALDRSLREALIEAVKPNERASMRLALEAARAAIAKARGSK